MPDLIYNWQRPTDQINYINSLSTKKYNLPEGITTVQAPISQHEIQQGKEKSEYEKDQQKRQQYEQWKKQQYAGMSANLTPITAGSGAYESGKMDAWLGRQAASNIQQALVTPAIISNAPKVATGIANVAKNPYVQNATKVAFATDGAVNLASEDGIRKTIDKAKDFYQHPSIMTGVQTAQSAAGDALNLAMLGEGLKTGTHLLNRYSPIVYNPYYNDLSYIRQVGDAAVKDMKETGLFRSTEAIFGEQPQNGKLDLRKVFDEHEFFTGKPFYGRKTGYNWIVTNPRELTPIPNLKGQGLEWYESREKYRQHTAKAKRLAKEQGKDPNTAPGRIVAPSYNGDTNIIPVSEFGEFTLYEPIKLFGYKTPFFKRTLYNKGQNPENLKLYSDGIARRIATTTSNEYNGPKDYIGNFPLGMYARPDVAKKYDEQGITSLQQLLDESLKNWDQVMKNNSLRSQVVNKLQNRIPQFSFDYIRNPKNIERIKEQVKNFLQKEYGSRISDEQMEYIINTAIPSIINSRDLYARTYTARNRIKTPFMIGYDNGLKNINMQDILTHEYIHAMQNKPRIVSDYTTLVPNKVILKYSEIDPLSFEIRKSQGLKPGELLTEEQLADYIENSGRIPERIGQARYGFDTIKNLSEEEKKSVITTLTNMLNNQFPLWGVATPFVLNLNDSIKYGK